MLLETMSNIQVNCISNKPAKKIIRKLKFQTIVFIIAPKSTKYLWINLRAMQHRLHIIRKWEN